jgi:hypothetical protein
MYSPSGVLSGMASTAAASSARARAICCTLATFSELVSSPSDLSAVCTSSSLAAAPSGSFAPPSTAFFSVGAGAALLTSSAWRARSMRSRISGRRIATSKIFFGSACSSATLSCSARTVFFARRRLVRLRRHLEYAREIGLHVLQRLLDLRSPEELEIGAHVSDHAGDRQRLDVPAPLRPDEVHARAVEIRVRLEVGALKLRCDIDRPAFHQVLGRLQHGVDVRVARLAVRASPGAVSTSRW